MELAAMHNGKVAESRRLRSDLRHDSRTRVRSLSIITFLLRIVKCTLLFFFLFSIALLALQELGSVEAVEQVRCNPVSFFFSSFTLFIVTLESLIEL